MWEAKLELDTVSCNAGISACGKGEQWQRTLALLSEMWDTILKPDSATALGSARAGSASSGSGLWRCSARCGRQSWSLTLQLQCWNQRVRERTTVAAGFGAAQRDVGGEIGAQRFFFFSYSAGISACGKGGQWQRALALLGEMWEEKLELDGVSCSAGISACEKGRQWQRALALLSKMWEAKLEPEVFYTSATTLG
ncbi:unnamed protein product [Prorocentrum cordatum]|uniref:Pentatricopeptide repeat-containing protein, chloroplastic n=1 Tax=Prorocentrum cordatum TaxID=2364126 RepID=A0ABN9VEG3_9DINO|nr:unnamed protein product [Polarella glacialis]